MGVPYAEVIGDPVAHSKSPLIHNFWLGKLGLDCDFRAARVAAGQLSEYLEERRRDPQWRGCSVTTPHKQAIMPLLDECNVYRANAANCVVCEDARLVGYNTDMAGIDRALPDFVDPGRPVCLIGAGGAAHAAVAELDMLAVFQFNVLARDPPKARVMVAPYAEYGRVFAFDDAREAMRGCGGLINASPLGMDGFDAMPASVLDSLPLLARGAFVIDMVYVPLRTQLLSRAEAVRRHWFSLGSGFHIADGVTMLIGQARLAFEKFFRFTPPFGTEEELRELLAR